MRLQRKTLEKLRILLNEETEYRSGPQLVDFFNRYGFNDIYGQGFPSRWKYTDTKFEVLNGKPGLKDCIIRLFSPVNFIGRLDGLDNFIKDFNQYLSFDGFIIKRNNRDIEIAPFQDDTDSGDTQDLTENEFLKKEFKSVDIGKLGLDSVITATLKQRMVEIEKCLASKSPLASIFLAGSTLEGILLGIALKSSKDFNQSSASPKDKDGKVLQFHQWTLNNLISVAFQLGLIKEDVKKFSHTLRDFRNYIHPFQQVSSKFDPDEHTATICWQVLKAAIFQLST